VAEEATVFERGPDDDAGQHEHAGSQQGQDEVKGNPSGL